MTERMFCYARRRLNPYLGVAQVVEGAAGRGVSIDGVNWEIQIRDSRPAGWGSLNKEKVSQAYFRFGVWSPSEGLAHFAVAPNVDPKQAQRMAATIIGEIASALPGLPFELGDAVECWLLDVDGKPLALLGSVRPGEPLPERMPRRWVAALPEVESQAQGAFAPLTAWVARRALPGPCWIKRDAKGNGILLNASKETSSFNEADFPDLLVGLRGCDDEKAITAHERLLESLAPRLLMLPLPENVRARIEVLAARQPTEMARFWRLYPAVCDPALLNSVRVQARLIESL